MSTEKEEKGAVESLYQHLHGISDEDFGKRISALMDEQPHLVGFIFNLDEEFTEEEHQELIKAAIVIRDVFVSAGMPLNMVVGPEIDAVIEEEVEQFSQFADEEVSLEAMAANCSSPDLFRSILKNIAMKKEALHNMGLILSVIIRLFEEAAGNKNENDEK